MGYRNNHTLTTMNELGVCCFADQQFDKATKLFEQCVRMRKEILGINHQDTLISMTNLANTYRAKQQFYLAIPLYEQVLSVRKARYSQDFLSVIDALRNLSFVYWSKGRLDLSIPLYEEALQLSTSKLGKDHLLTYQTAGDLGINLRDAGRPREAIPLLEMAYSQRHRFPQLDNAWGLALTYDQTGQHAKAEVLYRQLMDKNKPLLEKKDRQAGNLLAQYGLNLVQQKKYSEATELLHRCLDIRTKIDPDLWTTFNTQALLGIALLGQKKYAEAEPLLLQGYQGMKQREKSIPPQGKPRLAEALRRLITLYEEWGKPEEAAKWRKELPAKKVWWW